MEGEDRDERGGGLWQTKDSFQKKGSEYWIGLRK